MKEQTMVFNLSEPLEFSKGGEFETTYSLEIAPPSPKDYDLVMALAQKVTRAMLEAQRAFAGITPEAGDREDAGELNAEGIRMLLLSSTISISEYMESFKKLLTQTCTLDGTVKLKADLFEKIGIADRTNLLCEYAVNFVIPLAL